jgi:hypothetical protein
MTTQTTTLLTMREKRLLLALKDCAKDMESHTRCCAESVERATHSKGLVQIWIQENELLQRTLRVIEVTENGDWY